MSTDQGGNRLADNGKCCGRKPIEYKGGRTSRPMKFCPRCDREYDPRTGEQRENWAWHLVGGVWKATKP